MRVAGNIVAHKLQALRKAARPGVTTAYLNDIAHKAVIERGAKPNFLGYSGFPGSVCISVNEEIVHGIPGERVLQPGDIVSFDGGAVIELDGKPWHGDAAITVVLEGGDPQVTKRRRELSAMTEKAMWAGIAAAAQARRVGDIGAAIERDVIASADTYGWEADIVEGYTGHGIGNALHEDPEVYNYRTRTRGPRVLPGTVICIEPMLVAGDAATTVLEDDWTVVTVSGADAAHWEQTVAIGESGISVLTSLDAGAAGLAPYGISPVTHF